MWLQLCTNLTLGLLCTKPQTNGDQWKEGHAVIETHVFDMFCVIFADLRRRDATQAVQVKCILFTL